MTCCHLTFTPLATCDFPDPVNQDTSNGPELPDADSTSGTDAAGADDDPGPTTPAGTLVDWSGDGVDDPHPPSNSATNPTETHRATA